MEAVVASTKRYENYKDSGIEWIGKIPEHWEVSRLKNHIKMITGFPFKSEKYTDEGIKLARGINVKEGVLNWRETRCWPKLEDHLVDYLLKDGDVLIAMDGSKVGKNFCQIKESDLPILLLQRVARLRPKKSLISNYLYINIVNRNFLLWVEMTKTDPMVPHIAPSDIKNFQIAIPPIKEQTAIANFLDDKTTKIDQAIAIKEQQIARLKELKQILIHNAVTRGLDDTVALKDSGVEWIGKIPEHWKVKRLKFTSKLVSEKVSSKESELKYIGMENIESWTGKFLSSDSETDGLASSFTKGDILFGKLRPYLAKVYLTEKDGICSTEFLVYRTGQSIYNWYLNLIMLSFEFINLIDSSTYGSKMPRANSEFIGNQLIPIPPLPEQKQISEYIESASQKIETAIGLKQQEIEKLKEYKGSLINSVVTGKVRVSDIKINK